MDMNKKLFCMMLSLLLGGSIFTGCSDENSGEESRAVVRKRRR